jgi:hypothetical protein
MADRGLHPCLDPTTHTFLCISKVWMVGPRPTITAKIDHDDGSWMVSQPTRSTGPFAFICG